MMKRRLCCSWEHLLCEHDLTSVVSPSATFSLAAQPMCTILVRSLTSTLVWRPMLEMSAALLSAIFTTSVGSVKFLISRQPWQLSRPSSSPAWTIATHICTGCHLHSSNGCRMQQPEWWPWWVGGSTSHWCLASCMVSPLCCWSPTDHLGH